MLAHLILTLKGGFARCFEVNDSSGNNFAAKTVAKASIKTVKTREKLLGEIKIHKMLKHPNIVQFIDFFEDNINVYILLEICNNNSMMAMLKKRKTLTEPESKYFLTQIIGGVMYMHDFGVIHRDLKLGNIFLDNNMTVKIGDFGLAALLYSRSERKKTICGTPNYIAPEVLFARDEGHSFEVDVWSIGIILYAMIFGKPPFQSKDVDAIYHRIKNGDYIFPEAVGSTDAREFIRVLLNKDPSRRPKLDEALEYKFFKKNFPPSVEPASILFAPRAFENSQLESCTNFENCKLASRILLRKVAISKQDTHLAKLVGEAASNDSSDLVISVENLRKPVLFQDHQASKGPLLSTMDLPHSDGRIKSSVDRNAFHFVPASSLRKATASTGKSPNRAKSLGRASQTLKEYIKAMKTVKTKSASKYLLNPPHRPFHFITKWIDYSNKYGIAYQLSNGMMGLLFKSNSIIQLNPATDSFETIEWQKSSKTWAVSTCTDPCQCIPSEAKRFRLVKTMYSYMQMNLRESTDKASASHSTLSTQTGSQPLLFMSHYFRLDGVVVFGLSDGSFQFNFTDHTKIILSAGVGQDLVLGFIDEHCDLHLWTACNGDMGNKLPANGVDKIICAKLETCLDVIERFEL